MALHSELPIYKSGFRKTVFAAWADWVAENVWGLEGDDPPGEQ